MALPVTVVVVPRERFSMAARALDVLYERTAAPFSLVYVDAGSPRPVRRLGFFLLRWSDAWNLSTLCRFREKWQLDADPRLPWQLDWLRDYRHEALGLNRLRAGIRRALGWRLGSWVCGRLDVVVGGLERLLIRLLARDGRRGRHRLDYRRADLTAPSAARRVA